MEKIAFFTDDDANMCNFYDCSRILIFSKEEGEICLERECSYVKRMPSSLSEVRESIQKIIDEIDDCRTVVFGNVMGAAYAEFDKKGFHIFICEECSEQAVNGVFHDIECFEEEEASAVRKKVKAEERFEVPMPVETNTKGIYICDLLNLQKINPELTSKMVLKNFFDRTTFLELWMLCAHIPPWIEQDSRFEVVSIPKNEGTMAVIRQKNKRIDPDPKES